MPIKAAKSAGSDTGALFFVRNVNVRKEFVLGPGMASLSPSIISRKSAKYKKMISPLGKEIPSFCCRKEELDSVVLTLDTLRKSV